MDTQQKLFRKASLERLSTPEQLDQLMQVTTPKGWLALGALCALLIMIVFWGIFGEVPTQVVGKGMILRIGGVFDIESQGAGQISEILVKVGETVTQGQLIAKILQPELEDQISKSKEFLQDLELQQQQSLEFNQKDLELKKIYNQKERENAEFATKTAEDKLTWLREKISNQEKLVEQGLITKQMLLDTKQEYARTESEMQKADNAIKQINVTENELNQKYEQMAVEFRGKVREAKANLRILEDQFKLNANVVSPYSGTILEMPYDEGALVTKESVIASLEQGGAIEAEEDAEVILYVGPNDGKRVLPGMEVQISPTNVKREQYGFIVGKVREVSKFPTTIQGMMKMLHNEALVKDLAVGGAPYEVTVIPEYDETTKSGYKWSSRKGPAEEIFTGTLVYGLIIVEKQRPIQLVIPAFKKMLGV